VRCSFCNDAAIVETRDLDCFKVLCEELHFGRAAQRLGVSPSTLSRRIAALERLVGAELFARSSRRVALTDAGGELAAHVPAALRQLERAISAARRASEGGWEI
jgi:DNA-binding transcriptional LysR family regulator